MSNLPAPGVLALTAGVTVPVRRREYAVAGFGLMGLKYLGEAALVAANGGGLYSPLRFLSPLISLRLAGVENLPDWVLVAMGIWTLPFVWVGVSMTVRRARDAGLSSLFGLLFFMPVVNYLLMFGLCVAPTSAEPPRRRTLAGTDRVAWAAVLGVLGGALLGLGMMLLSVFALGDYGATLFVGTPFAMGALSAFLLNLREPRSLLANLAVGALTVGISGGLMLLFALEGALCLAMAAPLALVLATMGVGFGYFLARLEHRQAILATVLPLPLVGLIEPVPTHQEMYEVVSSVDIAAPPQEVWDNVIGFGGVELPPPPEWFFNLGIAYPRRAHIEGTGVGAVRYCEFSTGPFVEPIRVWDEPHRLAFDVSKSPATMHEWSPYAKVHAPHLDGILQSRHGEFVLTPLADGGTHLEGHTWYTFAMAPAVWWTLWSDASIHAIHLRVLDHIKAVSEGKNGG